MRRTLYVLVCDICFTSTCIALANRQRIDTFAYSQFSKGRTFGKCDGNEIEWEKWWKCWKPYKRREPLRKWHFHTNAPFAWLNYSHKSESRSHVPFECAFTSIASYGSKEQWPLVVRRNCYRPAGPAWVTVAEEIKVFSLHNLPLECSLFIRIKFHNYIFVNFIPKKSSFITFSCLED